MRLLRGLITDWELKWLWSYKHPFLQEAIFVGNMSFVFWVFFVSLHPMPTTHVGFYPDQGSNTPAAEAWRLNHYTTKEV